MRIATAAVLAAVAAFVPAPARAAGAPPGEGLTCGFASIKSPFGEAGTRRVGEMDAGPLVIADGTGPRSGRIVCSIQVNSDRHTGPDEAVVRSLTTAGVVWLPQTPFEYRAGATDWIALCTHVDVDGGDTWYYDDGTGTWGTDASAAHCALAVSGGPEPVDLVDVVAEMLRAVTCPALPVLSPGAGPVSVGADGDVAVAGTRVWRCPPE